MLPPVMGAISAKPPHTPLLPIQHCSRISDKGHQMGRYLTPLQIFRLFSKIKETSYLISTKKHLKLYFYSKTNGKHLCFSACYGNI